MSDFTKDSLRERIALVEQETFLFKDTIRGSIKPLLSFYITVFLINLIENIRVGRLDATDEEVELAARGAK